ncbi:MAG: PGAP1 family protein [uncultured bacterium]|nr:MAG: PGAP1 family protein [uncultured bacterium]
MYSMKNIFLKLIYIFLIFFIYLFVIQSVFAFEFVKSAENPLTVNYINDYNNHLQVNVFKEGASYKGIFTIKRPSETYYSLGYFESNNGIDWQMKKEILNTGADLSNPSVIQTPTGYLLFVTRYDKNSVYGIYSSTCDLGFNCSPNLLQVIITDSNSYSESNGVFAGHPFQQENKTYLFFGVWGGDGFKIKLAYSDDLTTWSRCSNDKVFFYGADGPFPYIEDNDLYLFFHQSDSSGIKLAKSTSPLTCDSVFEDQGFLLMRDKNYDLGHLISPSVFSDDDGLKLYYSGLGDDGKWHLNMAREVGSEDPTSTLRMPIVILPGTFASWNRDAILHNKEVSYSDWKLQSFVKEYDGLINSLINIGYEKNNNLFLFPFDWRQSIEKTINDLNSYIQEKIWANNPNQKINIVGHSLGGLVSRIFAQKNKEKINQIITVGSPHQGVVQVYKPLESGEIDRDNTFFWLSAKIILVLNKSILETDRITLANKFPVAKDLFPTFNFLKDATGNEIDVNNITIKNSFLPQYNQNFSDIFPIFTAIYGEGGKNTPAGFIVETQNSVDQLLGNYTDGKPKESYFDLGDYTVLTKSAKEDTDAEKLNLDHGGLIYKKDGIKKILELLDIQFEDSQIVEGKGTSINSSLIFMIKSPATITVEFNNYIYNEENGIIFIPDAQSGNYNLKVQGTGQGKYEVVIGQISENNDLWESINGETTASQIDNYNILYNDQVASSVFPIPTEPLTIISTVTLTPSGQIYLSPMTASTPTQQPTNVMPEILGISSHQEKSITPLITVIKQKIIKKEAKKSTNILSFIWPSLIISTIVETIWLIRKKSTKKYNN